MEFGRISVCIPRSPALYLVWWLFETKPPWPDIRNAYLQRLSTFSRPGQSSPPVSKGTFSV
jgi:hypothetical protein